MSPHEKASITDIYLHAGLYSCKKDSGNSTPTVIGKWTHVKSFLIKSFNGVDSLSEMSINQGDYIQFNTDGSAVYKNNREQAMGRYILSGNVIYLNDYTFKIKTLTSNSLVLDQDNIFPNAQSSYRFSSEDFFIK